jgi:hypothetical protein
LNAKNKLNVQNMYTVVELEHLAQLKLRFMVLIFKERKLDKNATKLFLFRGLVVVLGLESGLHVC